MLVDSNLRSSFKPVYVFRLDDLSVPIIPQVNAFTQKTFFLSFMHLIFLNFFPCLLVTPSIPCKQTFMNSVYSHKCPEHFNHHPSLFFISRMPTSAFPCTMSDRLGTVLNPSLLFFLSYVSFYVGTTLLLHFLIWGRTIIFSFSSM